MGCIVRAVWKQKKGTHTLKHTHKHSETQKKKEKSPSPPKRMNAAIVLYRARNRVLRRGFRVERGAIRAQKDLGGYEPICEHCSAGDRIVL